METRDGAVTQYSLLDIFDIADLQKLQDSFAKANRVASTIIDLNGRQITQFSNYSRVCQLIRQTKKGSANCIRSGKILGEMSLQTRQPSCHFCLSVGFVDAAAPIVIEDVHIANWLIGQNCIGEVDEDRIVSYAEEIGTDSREMLAAFGAMEKISEKEFNEKLDFLWLMANQISNQAYQHIKNQTMLASLEQSQRELNSYKDNLEILVNERTLELKKAIEKIQQISIKDALTGCFNRGGINTYLPREIKRARRYNNPLSILLCDLDHFKRINDTYGHQAGDIVLQQVVAHMQRIIREDIDWIGRYGGEEFLLVLPLTPVSGAMHVAERLRKAIAEQLFSFRGETVSVTVSFG
ncbi:MAG: PocR ligand-binding domain-containing protein, partial [Desulfopila sp.]|nr:PocR ligand-binding domain-containing protein [Desulfopila sp.]